ncbi:molecular chaperone DnaJ [Sulfurimonas hongkongensis]|uniref:Molecular chaperone DnaJ n=1 Tax=Sulfurimonas hongkongensis TaxID=1172190 RepID=T0JEB2_9BACT|nr:DnaJ domain-containing protein [Sulfurimonas hongkongensis]EQB39345.1 molecular chaperone DnaJ [Sulfurimonas hongkongensis]
MRYEDFDKALESLNIVTRMTQSELKNQYLRLSKKYHPDMPDGSDERFKEISEAYKLIRNYMRNYRFSLDKDEFDSQNPLSNRPDDWFKSFNS